MSAGDWLALTYTDKTWVTQIDGVMAEDATGPVAVSRPTLSLHVDGTLLDSRTLAEPEEIALF
ncbi:hypothetical protein [Acrocarpospora catenulata]|uniref:hypothetical protein n=1 Tax=Acrocarpospora catenulata TaxID=2836182 RepID=UPI001BDA2527|nr:hypothetical protein [Acrocarpospora catenulata]